MKGPLGAFWKHRVSLSRQPRGRRGRVAPLAVMAAMAVLASACAGSQTELPALEKDNRQLLSKDQQKQTITSMGKKADDEAAAAKQQIEGRR